jgi:hypothetical protein
MALPLYDLINNINKQLKKFRCRLKFIEENCCNGNGGGGGGDITPAALTKTDDTNVTLTLGGTPSTALLQATSLVLGWTGTLADNRIASASTWSAKEPGITAGTTSQYWRGDKTWQTLDKSSVGLSNVDNTSDLNKPVSIATQTAIDNISVGNKLYLFNNY